MTIAIQTEQDIEISENTFIILHGAPGSGKSTIVEKIEERCKQSGIFHVVCSVDSWFMKEGQYVFNKSLLGRFHDQCKKKAWYYTGEGAQVIIIDNTNINAKECEPYAKIALEANYIVQFRESKTEWSKDSEELFKKNTHGVPLETIQKMLKNMETIDEIGTKLAIKFNEATPKFHHFIYENEIQTLRKS